MKIESGIEKELSHFVFPSLEHGQGEVKRIQQHFGIKTTDFVRKFFERAHGGKLVKLTDWTWDTVENTDSHSDNISQGDWEKVAECSSMQEIPRNWQSLRDKMENGIKLDAPIIARRGDILHLVSGNTRLVVARAMGVMPDVLIVDITDFQ